jgi:hypothetical protein
MNFADQIAMGQGGSVLQSGSGTVTPPSGKVIAAIQALNANVVMASSSPETGFADLVSGTTIPAGSTVLGRWTSIVLSEGNAIVYFG